MDDHLNIYTSGGKTTAHEAFNVKDVTNQSENLFFFLV